MQVGAGSGLTWVHQQSAATAPTRQLNMRESIQLGGMAKTTVQGGGGKWCSAVSPAPSAWIHPRPAEPALLGPHVLGEERWPLATNLNRSGSLVAISSSDRHTVLPSWLPAGGFHGRSAEGVQASKRASTHCCCCAGPITLVLPWPSTLLLTCR